MKNGIGVLLLFVIFAPFLSLADPPDTETYLIRGDVLSVRLGGFSTDQLWPTRAQGLVLISDRHNNTVRLCSNGLTYNVVRRLCYSLGYSGGREQPLGASYTDYSGLHTVRTIRCKGTERALEECTREMHDFGCYLEKFRHVELYCTNSWYGPNVPCGTDIGLVTALENNPWASNDPVAVELGVLTGVSSRSLVTQRTEEERIIQPTNILSAVEFPWSAKLNFFEPLRNKWLYRCAAAILTDRVVLTLAQCVSDIGYYSVTFGDFDTEVPNRFVETFQVMNTVIHPKYDEDSQNNDLAIVILKGKGGLGLQFRPSAFPVCLPTKKAPLNGNRKAAVAGWGRQTSRNTAATISRFLSLAKVKLYERSDCPSHDSPDSGIICAGNPDGGSDACYNEQGAPLVAKINGRSLLVGLLREPGCGEAGNPSKYVSIQHHVDWIKSKVAEIHASLNQAEQQEEDDDDDEEEEDIWADEDRK